MTRAQFVAMIGEAETGSLSTEVERTMAIGDGGRAGGYYQQHWDWRRDYWPPEFWPVLRTMDLRAIEYFLMRHPDLSARELADLYNLGHQASDGPYETRCLAALARLKIDLTEFDKRVTP